MPTQTQKFKIGLFVVVTIFLAMGVLVWLGASRFFKDFQTVVAYFTESVQGLENDSPVKFRGVPVGRVRAIRLAPDGRLIEVVMMLDRKFKVTEDLGLKMNMLGLTGMKYLEIDSFRQDQRIEAPVLEFTPRYPVVATYPSDIKELGSALDNIFQKVKTVDVERIAFHALRISARLDKILSDGKIDTIGPETADAVREIKEATRRFNEEMGRAQLAKAMTRTLDKANEFFQESTETARNADRMIRRSDNNLNRLTQKLDRSADNLVEFTRMIRQKPTSIIFGPDEKASPGPKR